MKIFKFAFLFLLAQECIAQSKHEVAFVIGPNIQPKIKNSNKALFQKYFLPKNALALDFGIFYKRILNNNFNVNVGLSYGTLANSIKTQFELAGANSYRISSIDNFSNFANLKMGLGYYLWNKQKSKSNLGFNIGVRRISEVNPGGFTRITISNNLIDTFKYTFFPNLIGNNINPIEYSPQYIPFIDFGYCYSLRIAKLFYFNVLTTYNLQLKNNFQSLDKMELNNVVLFRGNASNRNGGLSIQLGVSYFLGN